MKLTAVCSSTDHQHIPSWVSVTVSLHTRWSLQSTPAQTALTVRLPACLAPVPQTRTQGSSCSALVPFTMTSHCALRHRLHQARPLQAPSEHTVASTGMVLAGSRPFSGNLFLSLAFTGRSKVPVFYWLPIKKLTAGNTVYGWHAKHCCELGFLFPSLSP